MENNRKKIGILLIALGVLIIILILYFALKKGPAEDEITVLNPENNQPAGQLEQSSTTPSNIVREKINYDISQEEKHSFNATDLAKRAEAFAERFGSYSNQSNYENFSDLELFVTDSFNEWMSSYASKLRDNSPASSAYYGISTRALTVEVKSFDEEAGQATVNVITKRTESSAANGALDPYNQALLLEFIRDNGEWLVDAAYWEKR